MFDIFNIRWFTISNSVTMVIIIWARLEGKIIEVTEKNWVEFSISLMSSVNLFFPNINWIPVPEKNYFLKWRGIFYMNNTKTSAVSWSLIQELISLFHGDQEQFDRYHFYLNYTFRSNCFCLVLCKSFSLSGAFLFHMRWQVKL